MTKEEFNDQEQLHWVEEFKRCQESPYYFFTNYCIVNGKKATTWMTEEEFNELYDKFKNIPSGSVVRFRSRRY